MSLISPLLDGLTMGQPVSQHHGIQCCPALQEETGNQYMVKIISIPASQRQLDALLLTGAFPNELKAQEYFAQLADAVMQEVELLNRLSQAEGYLAYQGSQIVKMEEGVGFDVYLLSPYRESLEDQMRHTPLTHLEAVNLGLDMCAAMAVSRRSGYLHLNLRPANIFKTENRGFCIGDLGFIKLSSLSFASFPEKYRSGYTAPEIQDAMSPMNETLDIYALGLSLYQVYNNGTLPEKSDGPLPPPLYADYEMSEIILKACAPAPEDRWQTPAQMGQALVDYMQRNSVNHVSIIPAPVEYLQEQVPVADFLTEEENAAELATLLATLSDDLPPVSMEEIAEDPQESAALTEDGVTAEVAQMLAQADELIEHELPEPAIAPEPIDVPIPPPIVPDPEIVEEPVEEIPPVETPDEPEQNAEEDEEMPENTPKKIPLSLIIRLAAVAVVLIAVTVFGIYYYNNIYTQTIDALHISGVEDQILVRVETSSSSENLVVICTDAYGNSVQSTLTSGVALFNNMKPDTQYKIEISIAGWHKLVGQTTGSYTTGSQSKVTNFIATPGNEDGSVTLSFDLTGPDSKEWKLEYSATNIPAKTITFTGHSVELSDLNVGSVYSFRLSPVETLYLTGESVLEYTVKGTILAENLTISAFYNDFLSVTWNAPQDVFNTKWVVRCYNNEGYDQTIETTATSQIFARLKGEGAYTIVVTAEGVAKSVSITTEGMTPVESIPQNPDLGGDDTPDNPGDNSGEDQPVDPNILTITGYKGSFTSASWNMELTWNYSGPKPSGWILTYTTNGKNPIEIKCSENYTNIMITRDNIYKFEVRPADDVKYVTRSWTYSSEKVNYFNSNGFDAENEKFSLLSGDSTTASKEFSKNDEVYLYVSSDKVDISDTSIVTVTFVIRDDNSNVLGAESRQIPWNELWENGVCKVQIPNMPIRTGGYAVDLFFNYFLVTSQDFTIS